MTAAGRNDPCPCGSGKKYKRCCGLAGLAPAPAPPPTREPALDSRDVGALVSLANTGALDAAERRVRALLTKNPAAGILWKILSVTLLRQGKPALAELRTTVQLLPDDVEAHGNLGAALCDIKQWAEALVSLERVLALDPGNLQAMVDAANAHMALGRPQQAVALYRGALARDPRSSDAHHNLGLCLVALGRREEAVASYETALVLDPAHVEALDNLGIAWRELGERRRAEALHHRALEIDPRRARSHHGLGSAQLERGRADEAAASFRRALDLEPGHVPAHLGLAAALRQRRRAAEAQSSCEAALDLAPGSVEALWLLGELRADLGRFSEAQALYRRAIELDPTFPSAFCSMAMHRKMTEADTAWLAGVEALLAGRPPLAHEIGLRYALGKHFDDVGRYDQAFEQYRQANELAKRHRSRYDGAKLTRRVDRLIAAFDARSIDTLAARGAASERPVFVLGMPRSGTSLAEQILASHPAVFGAGELSFWDHAFDVHEASGFTGEAGAAAISTIADEYLACMTGTPEAALRVVDKMPANFLYVGLIHAAFPHARIIHMRRHPLDTCLSIYFQNFFSMGPHCNDLEHLAHYYGEYVRITDHWRTVLPASSLLELHYEDLIADQEHWTRRMLEFVDLPWDARCMDFHRSERLVITASKWQVRQQINAGSVGRWRNYEAYVGPLKSLLRGRPSGEN